MQGVVKQHVVDKADYTILFLCDVLCPIFGIEGSQLGHEPKQYKAGVGLSEV